MKLLRNKLLLATMLTLANVTLAQSGGQDVKIANPYSGYQKTPNGFYYKFFTSGNGAQPQVNELVDVGISIVVNDTTVILPESNNTLQMMVSQFPGDLFEGLSMMHIGDSASFLINIDSVFVKMFNQPALPEEFKSTDIMRFELRLDDIYPESEYAAHFGAKIKKETEARIETMKTDYPMETAMAAQQLSDYLSNNKVDVKPTASGLYYVRTQEGNGDKPKIGQMVTVHYIGKLLDGTVFDSSFDRGDPIVVPIGVGQVIPGWDEGIQLMSKGEKGVLYIPYYLAYGDREAGDIITPFSNLIFEVELIDFQ